MFHQNIISEIIYMCARQFAYRKLCNQNTISVYLLYLQFTEGKFPSLINLAAYLV